MSRCAKAFLANKRNFEVDSADKSVKVSQVFKWFPLDFSKAAGLAKKFPPPTDDEIVLSYLMKISSSIGEASNVVSIPPDFSSYRVIYRPFDWSLNDADEKPDVTKANSPQVHVPSSH
jgi:hypothetical protein